MLLSRTPREDPKGRCGDVGHVDPDSAHGPLRRLDKKGQKFFFRKEGQKEGRLDIADVFFGMFLRSAPSDLHAKELHLSHNRICTEGWGGLCARQRQPSGGV